MSSAQKPQEIADGCPPWAVELILKIRELEIQLGNIPAGKAWQTLENLEKLQERVFGDDEEAQRLDEETVERIFRKVAIGLMEEGFTSEKIAGFVNARVGYDGGPPYCSSSEVRDVLS